MTFWITSGSAVGRTNGAVVGLEVGDGGGMQRRRQRHHRVGAQRFGLPGIIRSNRMMRRRNGNDRRHLALGPPHNDLGRPLALRLAQVSALAGQRIGDNAMYPRRQAELHRRLQPLLVEPQVGGERRRDNDEDAAKTGPCPCVSP
jgi:hypothetical protein